MDEALNLADKICILKDGKLLQYDTPENILKIQQENMLRNL